jgi:hypothetical protein
LRKWVGFRPSGISVVARTQASFAGLIAVVADGAGVPLGSGVAVVLTATRGGVDVDIGSDVGLAQPARSVAATVSAAMVFFIAGPSFLRAAHLRVPWSLHGISRGLLSLPSS